jgi:serine/threonine protein phosphatase PrpC
VAEPEIHKVIPEKDLDFIVMGSDGIFDRLSSKQVSDAFWEEARRTTAESGSPDCPFEVVSDCCGRGVDRILNYAMETESMDNVSATVLCYGNFRDVLSGKTGSRASGRGPESNQGVHRITETSKEYASGDSENHSRLASRTDRASSRDQSA